MVPGNKFRNEFPLLTTEGGFCFENSLESLLFTHSAHVCSRHVPGTATRWSGRGNSSILLFQRSSHCAMEAREVLPGEGRGREGSERLGGCGGGSHWGVHQL